MVLECPYCSVHVCWNQLKITIFILKNLNKDVGSFIVNFICGFKPLVYRLFCNVSYALTIYFPSHFFIASVIIELLS